MERTVFYIRHFNDIDHLTPVMWKILQKKHNVMAIVMDPFCRISTDLRLQFLKEFPGFSISYYYQLRRPVPRIELAGIFQQRVLKRFIQMVFKCINRVFFSESWAVAVLSGLQPNASVFDWGGIDGPIRGKFFWASKKLNIPVLCFPHGLCALMDYELKKSRNGTRKVPDFVNRSAFDGYVFQSNYHKDMSIRWGLDPSICHILGSARCYPEWHELYLSLVPVFKSKNDSTGKIKVVFMLQQWSYKANKEETLALIDKLSAKEDIYLVVKEHTRIGGRLSKSYKDRFIHSGNVEFAMEEPSLALIRWSDIVINTISGIGVDVILQGKHLISPAHLHRIRTIYEETGACAKANNDEQVLDEIMKFQKNANWVDDYRDNIRELMDMVVYGSKGPHDVLESYYEFIFNKTSLTKSNNMQQAKVGRE